jgi:hypothetical protein
MIFFLANIMFDVKHCWLFSGSGVLSGRHDGRAAKALWW